ncbi:MAG: insulinase family protein [Gemmatimonadetes bacterium]|nr:insulinase family protein [Gemmatimonadota bacterium]
MTPLEHERHVLSCGTTVLVRPLSANDIVSVRAFLPMGTLWETDEEAGISRLLQNVLPRGTETRDVHALQEALADLGAELDSGAGSDLGSVSLRATAETWPAALELYLETLTRPAFDPGEVAIEVEQTLGALEAREDNLMTRAMDLFRERFFGEHPFHKPVMGYRKSVRGIDRDRVVSAANRFYRPVPPVVTAVGRLEADPLVDRLEAAFGREPVEPAPPRPAPPEPGAGTVRLELEREAAYLVHGYPAPSWTDPDYPAMRLIDAVLGGSMASRLFVELREKRALAYQVSSLYDDRFDGSYLVGYIVTDPGRVAEAAAGLEGEFHRLVDEPVDEEEVEDARRYLRGRYLITAETNAAQASRLGTYETYALGQDFGDRWLAAIEAVTPERILAAAARWLDGEPTRALVVPVGTPSF